MNISNLIELLEVYLATHGDLEVLYVDNDTLRARTPVLEVETGEESILVRSYDPLEDLESKTNYLLITFE